MLGMIRTSLKILGFGYTVVPVQVRPEAPHTDILDFPAPGNPCPARTPRHLRVFGPHGEPWSIITLRPADKSSSDHFTQSS